MKHNYDTVAWCYDRFSRLIFGHAQVDAQVHLLSFIPAGAHLLIAGGGTGWILEQIVKVHPSGLAITYVDASEKMIALAKQKNAGGNKVIFIAADIESAMGSDKYDVVITPFLFDNFNQEKAGQLFAAIDEHIAPKGRWLYCDFRETGILLHRLLMKLMYAFFRICCGVHATQMPDMERCFKQHRYLITAQKAFMTGFITSVVYKKG